MRMEATEYRAGGLRYRILENGDLAVDSSAGDDSRRVPLASIRHVRLYVAQGRGFCVLTPKSGRTLAITTPPRADAATCRAYAAFLRELHDRLATAAPDAELVAGHGMFFALHVICLVGLVLYAVMFVFALVAGLRIEHVAATLPSITLPLLTLASTSRGRPRHYSRGVVPPSFLPAC